MKIQLEYNQDDDRQKPVISQLQEKYGSIIGDNPDLIAVVGGDGAMISAMNKHGDYDKPSKLFGIGRGTVNFLMNDINVDLNNLELHNLSYYNIYNLEIHIDGEILNQKIYNDIVLGNTLMEMHTFTLNGLGFNNYVIRGSGLCISTALGSTAFNVNNNGTVLPLDDNHLLSITGVICNRDLNVIYNGEELTIDFETRTAVCIFTDGHKYTCYNKKGTIKIVKPLKHSIELFFNNANFSRRRMKLIETVRK